MPDIPTLVARLAELRTRGLSPVDAAAALMGGPPPVGTVAPDDLSRALADAFVAITAKALAAILHAQFPNASAAVIAQAVLAALPDTDKPTMIAALTGCGFTEAEAEGAADALYPTDVTIQSTQAWQPTGVTVTATGSVKISCSGSWTPNPADGFCGPDGIAAYTAQPGYAMAGQPEGAVVGKVGDGAPFLVGAAATVPPGQSGMLSLCINDDLDGRYGAGLTDNSGTMAAVVTVAPPG